MQNVKKIVINEHQLKVTPKKRLGIQNWTKKARKKEYKLHNPKIAYPHSLCFLDQRKNPEVRTKHQASLLIKKSINNMH